MKRLTIILPSVALLSLALLSLAMASGCSSQSTQPTAKPQPPELLTGRAALFQQLYIAARGWAADARPYQLQSQAIGEAKGKEGKAALWRAAFSSATQRGSKPYAWSGIDSPDGSSPRGISPGTQDSYVPPNAFDVAFLKVDSDRAFELAQKKGGDKVLAESPDTPVSYLLDWNPPGNNLIWHVIYGNSRNEAKLVVDLDASTGEFIRKEK